MAHLPCPTCGKHIGNLRANCNTCNRFASAVRTAVANELRHLFTGDLAGLVKRKEVEVYEHQHGTNVG